MRTPQSRYEEMLALFLQYCAERREVDWGREARLAFCLADDRPGMHALKSQALLKRLKEAGGEDLLTPGLTMRLILDAPPSHHAGFRSEGQAPLHGLFLKQFGHLAGPSLVAAALNYGESALPSLKWFMPALWKEFASLLIDLDEPLALGLLAPYLWRREVAQALDRAQATKPAETFVKSLQAVLSGADEPRLTARVRETICCTPAAQLRGWALAQADGADQPRASANVAIVANGAGAFVTKALTYMDSALSERNEPEADMREAPSVLRDWPARGAQGGKKAIVLAVVPIATPFVYYRLERSTDKVDKVDKGGDSSPAMASVILRKSLDYIHAILKAPENAYGGSLEQSEERWIREPLAPYLEVLLHDNTLYDSCFKAVAPNEGALTFFFLYGFPHLKHSRLNNAHLFDLVIERLGEKALATFLRFLAMHPREGWQYCSRFDAPEIAPLAADAFLRIKSARDEAGAWLEKFSRTAILRLIPDAVGGSAPARQAALHALGWLAQDKRAGAKEGGHAAREKLEEIAAMVAPSSPGLPQALKRALEAGVMALDPGAIRALPAWLRCSALTRAQLASGAALPESAMAALLQMLAMRSQDAVLSGLAQVQSATTAQSLERFAWDLFSMWLAHGAPPKDIWALRALGWLGGDACLGRLTALIAKWPGENASARAAAGLQALKSIGSDGALASLNGLARYSRSSQLRQNARQMIAAIALERGLSEQELAERLAPQLDLDERGGLDMDFGPRRFRVCFSEFLKPFIRDESGKRLKAFPRPNARDDRKLAEQAAARWRALNEESTELASAQLKRLENMLVTSQRCSGEAFMQFFVQHRFLRNLATRLVWGVYPGDDPATGPYATFRVCDDLSLAGIDDEVFDLGRCGCSEGRVGLVHPMELTERSLRAWFSVFADYETRAALCASLARETFALTPQESNSSEISRFEGIRVDPGRINDLFSKSWRPGSMDGSYITLIQKDIPLEPVMGLVTLRFANGWLGSGQPPSDFIALGRLFFHSSPLVGRGSRLKFGLLSAKAASELLRAPALLAVKGAEKP